MPSGVSEEVHACCTSGDAEGLAELCAEWEGNPVLNVPDEDSWSPAVWACKKGRLECLQLLIANWENEFDSKSNNKTAVLKYLDAAMDSSGMTLLMFAAIADACEVIRLLVFKCAKKDTVNEDGFTAHLWAAKCGNLRALQLLEELHCNKAALTRGGLSALECARVGSARRGTGKKGKDETVAFLAIRQAELDAAIAQAAAMQEIVE